MNKFCKNLNKIEFAVTYACTGNCIHCSEGEHTLCGVSIDPVTAARAVTRVLSVYDIKTVMAFGGEPLLYPDAVYAVMDAAKSMNVTKRQVITNGFFSKDETYIKTVARRLSECGVNELLLSVDAFHQRTIPEDTVMRFATAALENEIPVKLQPAWLVSAYDDNPYNGQTRRILDGFSALGIEQNDGNTVFPEGNALKYLSDYFKNGTPPNPYVEDPYDVKCLSFGPDGAVLDSNVYKYDILDIIKNYKKTPDNTL